MDRSQIESDEYRMYRTLNSLGWILGALWMCAAPAVFADEAASQFALAADHYSHQRWDLAAEEFEAFLGRFQDHERAPNAAFYLGESQLQLKQYADARVQYQRVVTQSPDSTFARQATFRAAEMLFLNGQHAEAKTELEVFDKDQGTDKLNAYSLAYRGQIAADAGEPEVAESLYREAIQRFPDGPLQSEVRFGLARVLELKGDSKEALRLYRFLAENSQSRLRHDAHLRAGILLHQQHQHDEAIAVLAKFDDELVASALRDEARYWTGITYLAASRPDDALTALSSITPASEAGALRDNIAVATASALMALKRYEDALEPLSAYIASQPDGADASACRAKLTVCYLELNDLDNLQAAFQQYRDHDVATPSFLQTIAYLAEQSVAKGNMELLQELLTGTPAIEQFDAVLYRLAWMLIDLGKEAESDKLFERLVREYPTSDYQADATYRLAERAFHRGDDEAANSYVAQLLTSNPGARLLSHSLYLQGQLAARQEKWANVAAPMQRLVDEVPESNLSLPARYWIAEASFRLANYAAAGEQFASLGQDIGDLEDAWIPMVPLREAQCLAHQENWTDAFTTARGVGERFPDFRQLYEADYVMGRCLSMQARFSEAREAFHRVVRSTTGGRTETAAMAQWMIGESFFHQKEYREAVRAYHRVVSLHAYPPWQAAALLQAGKCHEQSGEWQEAVKLYTQLLRDFPDTTHAADASQRMRVAQRSAGINTN